MPQERHARAFVAKGFSVIPLYYPNKDGACSCSKGAACKSSGKHPIGDFTPNGVDDATRDVRVIAKWFQTDQRVNLGVACGPLPNGRKLVVFDIDNTAVARAVLDPEIGIMDETATAGTGKGCHIYLYTDSDVSTHNLYLADLDHKEGKIGEIRSTGAYVAAPPSKHFSGVRYRWFGQPEDDESIPDIMMVADVDKFAAHLCSRAGFQIEPPNIMSGDLPEITGPIEPIDLPFKYNPLEYQRLWMFMSGEFQPNSKEEGGRSVSLFSCAHEIRRVAVELGQVITGEQIMGVLKKLDRMPAYQKYIHRRNPDAMYNACVWGPKGCLRIDETTVHPSTAPLIDRKQQRLGGKYGWDADRNMMVLFGKKDDTDLCNFRPFIEEELEIDTGDSIERAFKATFAQAMTSVSISITSDDVEGDRSLRKKFWEECSVNFNVYPEGWKHLPSILREGIKDVSKRRVYRHTGWIDTTDGRAFVFQGSGGAITADSINSELTFEEDPKDNMNPKLRLYGVGVRPIVTERDVQRAEKALIALIRSASPGVAIPIISQVIAGPLTSHGASYDPPLVHITGKTGSMKTSLATACLSIFGTFDRANVPESWMSTMASLQNVLHCCQDETLLIDDYKTGTAGRVASLIQQYSDRTTRSRMSSDQRQRKRTDPRGLMISTGEDMWEDQESTMARTIVVDMTKTDVKTTYLTRVQEQYIPDGWLQLVGGAYLAWLMEFEAEDVTTLYTDIRRKLLKQMQDSLSASIHGRLVGGLASLIAASRVFERFLKERLPSAYTVYKEASRKAWATRASALAQQGEEAREQSPYSKVIADIRHCLTTKEIKIVHSHDDNVCYGGGLSAPTIGFFDDNWLYLGYSGVWQWFSQRRVKRGENPTFTWRSVRKDALDAVNGSAEIQLSKRGNARVIRLPRSEIGMSGDATSVEWADFANSAASEKDD